MQATTMSRIAAISAIAVSILLSGCGGGAISTLLADVRSGGTGARVLGVLTGFGSLIVDGMRRDDSMATYLSEEDQGAGLAMASTGMMLGHSLELSLDASDNVTSVMVSPELVGTVTGAGANGITVLGTSISVNRDTALGPATVLVGYASPSAIQIGDRVAVYGLIRTNSQGAISLQATLIASKTTGSGVRLTGYITQYNGAAGSFVIGNQTVTVGSATLSPAGGSLVNGELVTVWSKAAPIGNSIAADSIRIKGPTGSSGTLTLSGPVSGYASPTNFKIRNVTVDARNATVSPAGAAVSDGKYVVAIGNYDASTNTLTASAVTIYAPAPAASVELHGTILNFVSPASFTVRGVVVDASSASVVGGTAAQLGNGVFVEVSGAVANNVVKAATVQIVSLNPLGAPSGAMLDLMGTITSYDAASGHYTMTMSSGAAVTGTTSSSMFYANGTAANFAIGQSVNVRGMMNNNLLSTSVMDFAQGSAMPASGITHMEGVAYNVTPSSFMLNGLTIQLNGIQIPGGGGMMGGHGMMAGSRVGVDVLYSGGQYMATALNVQGG
ncbi:MAG: DUF5666 domain-containing protein [Proteobacteria bacterium]|nr:DUF5666 domain-containing protein [Pseudomonadota bacterium]